jgi:hypothetical protein
MSLNMLNLITINEGFIMNESEYHFQGEAEILDKTQAHVPTDKGVIFCDTSMSVNEKTFENINDFLNELYEQ